MRIYTGGESTAIDSPRYLTLRHARKAVSRNATSNVLSAATASTETESFLAEALVGQTDPEPPDHIQLDPGQEQLSSYWSPNLTAGDHLIDITQTVNADGQSLTIPGRQPFTVDAPQFVLPEGSVHSTYPPPAYSDDHRILPHVVLTDPHLPWERDATVYVKKDSDRNRIPWLALFTFTQDELRLSPDDLSKSGAMFENTRDFFLKDQTVAKQSPTMTLNMTVADLLKVDNTASPVRALKDNHMIRDETLRADWIFLDTTLFINLFSTFTDKNAPQGFPNVSQYQYLSHVRNINTTGMAVSGVEENGIFSIVIGARSGPLENHTSESVTVHLVSIEGVSKMSSPITASRVAMCSLYSWNYTVLPTGQLNVEDAFESIGNTLERLRPPVAVYKNLKENTDPVQQRVGQRLADGYSLLKYRMQTGEQTIAMYRGPLTPTIVDPMDVNDCSNSGIDLMILDQEVGILDISYSSAWQLGRTLALGDQAFTAALSRFRSAIRRKAMKDAKLDVIASKSPQSIRTKAQLLSDLPTAVANLALIHAMPGADGVADAPAFKSGGPRLRWARSVLTPSQNPSLATDSAPVKQRYIKYALAAAEALSMSTTEGVVYDETNAAISSDWMIILAWLMDRVNLVGIPAHYLISDPCHLPKESLRFFHIDQNWIDAMIDGALSLANHMGFDQDRVAIKHIFNRYVKHKPDGLQHTPQIPSYGFYLRSALVTMFPDLRVVTNPEPSNDRAPILRHEIVSDGVMLCLLDRLPGSSEFDNLVFIQPPHQQRFAVSTGLTVEDIAIKIRRQYTVPETQQPEPGTVDSYLDVAHLPHLRSDPDNFFIWGSNPDDETLNDLRLINASRFAEAQRKALEDGMHTFKDGNNNDVKYFDDDVPTSALFALQLNDPNYRLWIKLAKDLMTKDTGAATTPTTTSTTTATAPAAAVAAAADPNTAFTPRVLLRTNAIEAKNEFTETVAVESPEAPHENTNPEPDHDALAAAATFERSSEHVPGLNEADAQPPNRTAIQFLGPSNPPPTPPPSSPTPKKGQISKSATREVAMPPVFHVDLYTNTPSNDPAIRCSSTSPPQDIVLSIRLTGNDFSPLQLVEFAVRIPMGSTAAAATRHYMFENYTAGTTAPTMMSNLRFNALAAFDKDPEYPGETWLVVRVLPRAAKGWTLIRRVGEMSVLLPMAVPNVYSQQRVTMVEIKTRTFYMDDHTPGGYREQKQSVRLINTDIH